MVRSFATPLATFAFIATACVAGLAHAQHTDDSPPEPRGGGERAENSADPAPVTRGHAIFQEGRDLILQGRYEEASRRFLESERLDPGAGTLLNLAYCYEKLGRPATAWAIYREAAAMAADSGRSEWSDRARDRVASLEGSLFRVPIEARADAVAGGLHVFVDGAPLPESAWGERVPLYPGTHEIRAEAASKKTWTLSFQVDAEHLAAIAVPELTPSPPPAPAPAGPTAIQKTTAQHHSTPPERTLAVVLGGAGLSMLTVAAGLGLAAESTYDGVHCPRGVNCTPSQLAANSRAFAEGDAATVVAITGGAAIACAGLLWFAFPLRAPSNRPAELAFVPLADAALVGASVRETW